MNLENLQIRRLLADRRITFKAVADELSIRADGLSRTLRLPLTDSMKQRILTAVDKLSAERGTTNNDTIHED